MLIVHFCVINLLFFFIRMSNIVFLQLSTFYHAFNN